MFYTCCARFDMRRNLKNFIKKFGKQNRVNSQCDPTQPKIMQ